MRHTLGLVGDNCSLDRYLLGVGAFLTGFANAKDLIAYLKICDVINGGADDAGKISTQNKRKLSLLVLAGPYLPIGAIDARCDDIDQHLALSGNGIRQVPVLQDFRPAVSLNESCLHRCLPCSRVD